MSIENKKFLDIRTDKIVTQFSILDIRYMKELSEREIENPIGLSKKVLVNKSGEVVKILSDRIKGECLK